MPVTYQTIEKVQECNIPGFNYNWPQYDGCGARNTYYSALNYPCPTSTTSWYEPEFTSEGRDIRRLSGKRVGYPPYGFTPYARWRNTTRNHLLRRSDGSNLVYTFQQYGRVAKVAGNCQAILEQTLTGGPFWTEWRAVTHTFTGTEYVVSQIRSSDVDAARQSIQDAASLEALTSYDILTDLAEAREIPELVKSVSSSLSGVLRGLLGRHSIGDLRSGATMPIVNLLKHPSRALRRLGNDWMAYRYGIMPLVYSYRDIKKTLKRGENVRTYKVQVVQPYRTGVSLPAPTTAYKWSEVTGEVTFRASVFQNFAWSKGAQVAGLGVNPLTTLWELIPYSFVVDWFVNVGDYITRSTSRPMSRMNWACISQRSKYTKKTWVHYPLDNKSLSAYNHKCANWLGANPPASPSKTISRPEESQLLQEDEVDAYQRDLFYLNDAQLTLSPSMNWRRFVDSAVMANNQLGAFNRFLKGR